ncbi:MAG: hydroxymethylbilane synthase [Coriobacteriales bacterium]|jgi:hydroxymethylbilane synthase|nr:hydroxymethylbilane synthase [Coriobacteriales bacterium]
MKRIIRIGSRESALAVRQAEIVMQAVLESDPDIEFELVTIRTMGDKILDQSLDAIGGKGLFIKELEQALLDNVIDIAVHSYKDLPYAEHPDLPIVALSSREAPFDVLVLPDGSSELDNSIPIGSSSQRRSIQLKRLFQDIEIQPVRGNVNTRLAKLDLGIYSALVLAQAGLQRLGLRQRITRVFTAEEMIPAGSQGILAVQSRKGENCAFLAEFHNWQSEVASLAERQFLRTLASDCTAPVAVFAELNGNHLLVRGMTVDTAGQAVFGHLVGDAARAQSLGEQLAMQMIERSQ